MATLSRRALLGGAAAVGTSAALGGRAGSAAAQPDPAAAGSVPFYGPRQAGIATSPPSSLVFAAFDLTTGGRGALRDLLRRWSAAAERMTRGLPPEPGTLPPDRPPLDSGETLGMQSARLTVTFGLGPAVFDSRFGLSAARPACLRPLPALPYDDLEPARCGGDLMVQACADREVVAFHAVRQLRSLAAGVARLRWLQRGFGATARTRSTDGTPRNLFGMKDGTLNPTVEQPDFTAVIEVAQDDRPAWLRGGSFAAVRRIRMRLDHWDSSTLADQQETIGRYRASGAPLSGGTEFTPPDFTARDRTGKLAIPARAHIRVVHPDYNDGAQMLRRGYNFDDGMDATGQFDAGLFFVAYVRDLDRQVLPVLASARQDALNEYTRHVGSAVFAVPAGTGPGGYVGETLLG